MVAAILFGRGGSKTVKNKNIYPILGRPLMEYPILAAQNSKYIDKIYLSTDSEDIMSVGRTHGIKIIERPDYLATDAALLSDAIIHGYNYVKEDLGSEPEMVALLLCNAATIMAGTIDEAVEILLKDERKEIDSVVTVDQKDQFGPIRAKKIENGLLVPLLDLEIFSDVEDVSDRKCMGSVYFIDASLWLCRSRCMDLDYGIPPFKWIGKKTVPIVQQGGLDVDVEEDLVLTEQWLKKRGFTETKTPYE